MTDGELSADQVRRAVAQRQLDGAAHGRLVSGVGAARRYSVLIPRSW